jgi:hypothetical protein
MDVARKTFAHLMEVSRSRPLGPAEKRTLARARQTLRQARKPAMNPRPPGDYQEYTTPKFLTAGARLQIRNLKKQGWDFLKTIVYPSGTINHHLISNGRTAILKEDGKLDMLYPVGTSVHDALKKRSVTQGYGSEPNPRKRKRRVNPETCPICGRSAGSPYRVYDDRGKVISGCVSDFHTGHLVTPSESSRFHSRKEAVSIRRKLAKGQAGKGYSNPPNPTEIYRDITRVEGTKGEDSQYPGEKFFHNFKRPYPKMIGLKNGSLLIRSKR